MFCSFFKIRCWNFFPIQNAYRVSPSSPENLILKEEMKLHTLIDTFACDLEHFVPFYESVLSRPDSLFLTAQIIDNTWKYQNTTLIHENNETRKLHPLSDAKKEKLPFEFYQINKYLLVNIFSKLMATSENNKWQ